MIKKCFLLLIALSIPNSLLYGMQSEDVTVNTTDNQQIVVPAAVVTDMLTLKDMAESITEGTVVDIPFSSSTLTVLIELIQQVKSTAQPRYDKQFVSKSVQDIVYNELVPLALEEIIACANAAEFLSAPAYLINAVVRSIALKIQIQQSDVSQEDLIEKAHQQGLNPRLDELLTKYYQLGAKTDVSVADLVETAGVFATTHLYLGDKKLTDLYGLRDVNRGDIEFISTIDLSDNLLTDVPPRAFADFPRLTLIILTGNQLLSPEAVEALRKAYPAVEINF